MLVRRAILYSAVGWSDFEKSYVMPNCGRTPIPKLHVFMLPLSLVAGPQKMLNVTLKCAKQFFDLTFLKVNLKQNMFFSLFKSEN